VIYEDKIDFKNNTWRHNDNLTFNFKVKETDKKYNINVNITHSDYNYRNLIFFSSLYNDSLLIQKDTFNIKIYDKYGQPKGKGMTNMKKASFSIYKNYNFKKEGFYNIKIEQAFRIGNISRVDSLSSLYSFGIVIREQINKSE
tara:strand:- start:304 stop:732 length:429 start_codon:yes stop_codon:yes gene_type:complete